MTLSVSETQRLIEQVEDAEGSLTSMLTSLHIGPMRATAKMWSKKLAQVSAVLAKVICAFILSEVLLRKMSF